MDYKEELREELKGYIIDNKIPHTISKTGVWSVKFADMNYTQREYIMSPEFAPCGFSGLFGISF